MSYIQLSKNMPYSYYKEKLIELHEQIKNHPFREKFTDQFNEGTFRSLFSEYYNLIYDITEVFAYMEYYCEDSPLERGDGFWIHDFRNAMLTMSYVFGKRVFKDDEYFNKPIEGFHLNYREILAKTGINDINQVMMFFEKFIGAVHRVIETDHFNYIPAIEYEPCTKPHNGYYYKHMCEYERTPENTWKLVNPIIPIGTVERKI